jgi:hypothetical protein
MEPHPHRTRIGNTVKAVKGGDFKGRHDATFFTLLHCTGKSFVQKFRFPRKD